MITLYDLAAGGSIKCWSPNPWKARYILNYKKLPYRTIYVDFENVNTVIKEAGFASSRPNPDGTPAYTVPSIIDDATGALVTDSYSIAEYLDKQYPDTPKAFPPGTEALQAAFYAQWNTRARECFQLPIIVTSVPRILTKESSLEYFYRTRSLWFGKPLDQIRPQGEDFEKLWKQAVAFFDELDSWYAKSSGQFLTGKNPSFADFTVAGTVKALKIVRGEDSEDWQRFSALNNGRWAKLEQALEKYASVEN
ncbi:hypothetical protein NP233_g11820 [Leucocoprinus birnbaumii]|uniref:GST N-terminal domain-containing protein n=1 Tax=Leucocoprinus birnbaumii TaxID=56174 RepID=A0AAD5VLH2_9AGAR|nr:hypothetical protein NP233_g11820 [Leucocoprinus birnbaumii]